MERRQESMLPPRCLYLAQKSHLDDTGVGEGLGREMVVPRSSALGHPDVQGAQHRHGAGAGTPPTSLHTFPSSMFRERHRPPG